MTTETNGQLSMEGMATDAEGAPIKNYLEWLAKGTIITGIDFQRNFVWPVWKRTNLILSAIIGLPIPSINVYRPVKGSRVKNVFDGKQRLTTFQQFTENVFALDTSKFPFPTFVIDGKEYNKKDFHNKKFYELDEIGEGLKDIFLDRNIKMEIVSGASDDLAEVFFSLMNMGAEALKPQEIRLATMGHNVRQFFNSQKEMPIFAHAAMSDKQKMNNVQHDILAQIALLLHVGLTDLTSPNVDGFINQFRNTGLPENLQSRIENVIFYLSEVTELLIQRKKDSQTTQTKGRKADQTKPIRISFLSKLGIVSLAMIADKAITANVDKERFVEFATEFFAKVPYEYSTASSSKTASAENVKTRITVITQAFEEFAPEVKAVENVENAENTEMAGMAV